MESSRRECFQDLVRDPCLFYQFDPTLAYTHTDTHTHTHTHTHTVFLERKTKAFHLGLWLQGSSASYQLCDSELISLHL